MVVRMLSSSLIAINKKLKSYLGWDKEGSAGANILCRALKQKNMHTFQGMVGYCMKDEGEPHFQKLTHNVTVDDINKGVELYTLYGVDDLTNRVCLTSNNIFDRAAMYWKFKMRHPLGNDFLSTLHIMVRTGKYYPSSSWIIPYQGRGMYLKKIRVMWCCMAFPSTVTYQDIVSIFVANDLYANAQPRADWFRSQWEAIERYLSVSVINKELTDTTAFKETNVDDPKANVVIIDDSDDDDEGTQIGDDFMPLVHRTEAILIVMEEGGHLNAVEATDTQDTFEGVEEDLVERLKEILLQIWTEVHGHDNGTLKFFIKESVKSIKNVVQDCQVNVADIKVADLEEQIVALREVSSLKVQLNKLNALVIRLNNVIGRFRS
ncbi:hypothetical protein GOP47_0007014 [Adiantum capillus-veneris]|uniref:Uncharacterized protein n=1 Tax=Adiantum capillus-veneris TaxID=13818 RepID=A0A9D4UZW5_ADICA|nr:hypothetical protein GOP47_0007014 [Adiantum capillus-veneris]